MSVLHYCIHKTPVGELLVAESDGALIRVAFARENFDVVLGDLSDVGVIEAGVASVALHVATHQLDEYFRGERGSFDVPLGADPGTPLKRAVRETLLSTEPGGVMTYKELAEASGFPSATRAAASACPSWFHATGSFGRTARRASTWAGQISSAFCSTSKLKSPREFKAPQGKFKPPIGSCGARRRFCRG